MSDKTEESYKEVFRYLQNNNIINPQTIIIGFELALKNSLRIFPTTLKIYGCSFHLGQSIWKKIQNM